MKDYAKYNFDTIRGAYVEMDVRDGKGNTIHPSGKIIYREKNTILIESEGKLVYHYYIYDITPGSLTAKIKVEDMTLKQIKHYAEALKNKNGEKEVYFMINSDVLPNEENQILFFGTDTIGDRYRTEVWLKLSDTIDCTDWGWEHE